MMIATRKTILGTVLMLSFIFCVSCPGRTYLMVDYTVPPATRLLSGQTVRVLVVDQRADKSVLTPAAADQFSAFADRYSLAWVMPDSERVLAGEHDVTNMFRESFKKRLTQMGATVSLRSQSDIVVLTINLTDMKIDLQNRKWMVGLSYDAELAKNSRVLSREQVRGNAERVRIVGRKGADMALSEIFTDATNRLDLVKMFTAAKLIP